MKIKMSFLSVGLLWCALTISAQQPTSPNGKLSVVQDKDGFVVNCQQKPVLEIPAVGFENCSALQTFQLTGKVTDDYQMLAGKKLHCTNEANEYEAAIGKNARLVLRVYNNGIAFRYELKGLKKQLLPKELTTYRIPEGTKRWMQNWTDSYEEFFPLTTTANVPPRRKQYDKDEQGYACRWGYPALLEPIDGVFALISEANIERRQSASCLYNKGELFQVTPAENELKVSGEWHSPWRTIIIGSLGDLVESTLITDVSEPNKLSDTEWVKPGTVSWIYWAYNHGSNDYNIIKKYVDMAVTLKLPYVLIDAEWDDMNKLASNEGKTIEDAVKYANSKGIKPMIWYNSSVGWIEGAPTPLFRLNKPEDREKEFAWCEKIGVAGVKIDFFSGDNQLNMDYCQELLECAAKHHLLVNFHGATVPRGWQRTYPNLMSTEGVYGAEWYNNVPTFTTMAACHNATLPFTRNIIGPMDYTPCTFSDSQHPHITSNAHELALTVLYESALQHLADKPESYLAQPEAIQQFLSKLPTVWEETRYVSGYPGESAVLARRCGKIWYVAGINGTDQEKTLALNLDFIEKGIHRTTLYLDDPKAESKWAVEVIDRLPENMVCQPRGGFVAVIETRQLEEVNMPLFQTKFTADPAPLVVGDTLFLYTSHDASPEDIPDPNEKSSAGFFMYDWLLWSTTDMVNWTEHGAVASLKDFPWRSRENGAWAIQTVERNGKYYLYAPLHGHGIGVLVADSPYGPFKDPLGKPLVWDKSNWYDIDPSVYTDTDGQAYLYWGNPYTFYARLNDDMISLKDSIVRLPHIENYQEGPWFYKRDGHYYLGFASTCCPEGLGYAMSDSPTGPWESKGYIMRSTERDRGNHPGIVDFKGHTYVFGQNYDLMHRETFVHHERRSVSATEMTYNADGTIQEVPYWLDQQPIKQLKNLNPYQRVEAETMAWGYGLKSAKMGIENTGVVADMPTSTGKRNMYIFDIDNGEYIRLRGVDFGCGADSYSITAAATGSCEVTLRLDGQDGPAIGTLTITSTGSLDEYRAFSTKVNKVAGVHDLYICFDKAQGDVRLDWWKFDAEGLVTFQYKNDEAKEVLVDVQFAGRHPMKRDAKTGLWTTTLGPAAPDMYPYCFIVDGVSVMDPENPQYFPNEGFKNSLLELPSKQSPLAHDIRQVPHGSMMYVHYYSKSLGATNNAIVYLPPSYQRNHDKRYPVFYLISGTTDTEEVYYKVGRCNYILDNLIAEGKAEEMIIVLPYGNPYKLLPAPPTMAGIPQTRFGQDVFSQDLINDLMPYVEQNFRTINDADHRAIGGFSRGGNQALFNGLSHLDKFSYLCSYSSFTSTDIPNVYDQADKTNKKIHLFWLGVGTDDFLYGNARDYMAFLDSHGIRSVKEFTHDKFGHTWMNAKYFLSKTMPLLFKPTAAEEAMRNGQPAPAATGKEPQFTAGVMARLFPKPIISPEYKYDSIIFRFKAPNAHQVSLMSDLLAAPVAMQRDADGIWSVEISEHATDVFTYYYLVDGTKVADPENMYLAPQNGFKPSICRNPAAPYTTAGDIAHGKLCYNLDMNEAWYMPAAEFTGGAPVLIQLVPGKDDTMESWFKIAGANMMADILIAQKRIKPCILTTSKLDFMKQAGNDRLPNVKTLRADDFKTWAERRQALEKLLLSSE